MKITALEEYGLRCLLQLAKSQSEHEEGLSISEIAKREGLSIQYVSKITAQLKKAGLVEAIRGVKGGYRLLKRPSELRLMEVSKALGHPLFDPEFCGDHAGKETVCVHEKDCSIRSVWSVVYHHVNQVLSQLTLQDLLKKEIAVKGQLIYFTKNVDKKVVI